MTKETKRLAVGTAVLGLSLVIGVSCWKGGYNKGHELGYSKGFDEGYESCSQYTLNVPKEYSYQIGFDVFPMYTTVQDWIDMGWHYDCDYDRSELPPNSYCFCDLIKADCSLHCTLRNRTLDYACVEECSIDVLTIKQEYLKYFKDTLNFSEDWTVKDIKRYLGDSSNNDKNGSSMSFWDRMDDGFPYCLNYTIYDNHVTSIGLRFYDLGDVKD